MIIFACSPKALWEAQLTQRIFIFYSPTCLKYSYGVVTFFIVHGNWSSWSSWPNCNKPCNGGSKSRKRLCDNPRPANGGRDCEGPATESQSCNPNPCPGLLSSILRCYRNLRNSKSHINQTPTFD